MLQGVPQNSISAVVEQTLEDVDLSSKRDTKACNLSGEYKLQGMPF